MVKKEDLYTSFCFCPSNNRLKVYNIKLNLKLKRHIVDTYKQALFYFLKVYSDARYHSRTEMTLIFTHKVK